MMTMNENVDWMKPTLLLSIASLTLGPPFVHLPSLHKIKNPSRCTH